MKARERVSDLAYAGGWSAVRWMPESTARSLFRSLADRATERDGDSVRQLRRNLARVQPDLGERELDALVKEAMRRYLRYWREAFRLPSLSPEQVLSTFHVPTGGDMLAETLATGRGVVISLPHMGNWDHAGAWAALTGAPVVTVAERLVTVLVVTGLDGFGVPYVQAVGLWLLAVATVITVFQRMLEVRRQTRAAEAA